MFTALRVQLSFFRPPCPLSWAPLSGLGSVPSACSQASHSNLQLVNAQSGNDDHSRQLRKIIQLPCKSPKSTQRPLSALSWWETGRLCCMTLRPPRASGPAQGTEDLRWQLIPSGPWGPWRTLKWVGTWQVWGISWRPGDGGGVQAKRRERKPQGGAGPTRRLAEWPTWCVWRIRFPFTQDSAQTSLTDSPVTSH